MRRSKLPNAARRVRVALIPLAVAVVVAVIAYGDGSIRTDQIIEIVLLCLICSVMALTVVIVRTED